MTSGGFFSVFIDAELQFATEIEPDEYQKINIKKLKFEKLMNRELTQANCDQHAHCAGAGVSCRVLHLNSSFAFRHLSHIRRSGKFWFHASQTHLTADSADILQKVWQAMQKI